LSYATRADTRAAVRPLDAAGSDPLREREAALFGLDGHCAELVELELASVAPEPALSEEDRARRAEPHRHRDHQQERSQQQQRHERDHAIDRVLDQKPCCASAARFHEPIVERNGRPDHPSIGPLRGGSRASSGRRI